MMTQRTRWLWAILWSLTMAFCALLLLGGNAAAQEGNRVELPLTPSRDSGVSGTAALTEVVGGVEVELRMQGLPEEGVEHINHFHGGGTCAEDQAGRTAPVMIPLEPVVAGGDGTGAVTTLLEDATIPQLFEGDEERFILLHARAQEGGGVPPGISCADLVQADVDAGMLPESGGMDVVGAALLAAGLASVLLGALVFLLPKALRGR